MNFKDENVISPENNQASEVKPKRKYTKRKPKEISNENKTNAGSNDVQLSTDESAALSQEADKQQKIKDKEHVASQEKNEILQNTSIKAKNKTNEEIEKPKKRQYIRRKSVAQDSNTNSEQELGKAKNSKEEEDQAKNQITEENSESIAKQEKEEKKASKEKQLERKKKAALTLDMLFGGANKKAPKKTDSLLGIPEKEAEVHAISSLGTQIDIETKDTIGLEKIKEENNETQILFSTPPKAMRSYLRFRRNSIIPEVYDLSGRLDQFLLCNVERSRSNEIQEGDVRIFEPITENKKALVGNNKYALIEATKAQVKLERFERDGDFTNKFALEVPLSDKSKNILNRVGLLRNTEYMKIVSPSFRKKSEQHQNEATFSFLAREPISVDEFLEKNVLVSDENKQHDYIFMKSPKREMFPYLGEVRHKTLRDSLVVEGYEKSFASTVRNALVGIFDPEANLRYEFSEHKTQHQIPELDNNNRKNDLHKTEISDEEDNDEHIEELTPKKTALPAQLKNEQEPYEEPSDEIAYMPNNSKNKDFYSDLFNANDENTQNIVKIVDDEKPVDDEEYSEEIRERLLMEHVEKQRADSFKKINTIIDKFVASLKISKCLISADIISKGCQNFCQHYYKTHNNSSDGIFLVQSPQQTQAETLNDENNDINENEGEENSEKQEKDQYKNATNTFPIFKFKIQPSFGITSLIMPRRVFYGYNSQKMVLFDKNGIALSNIENNNNDDELTYNVDINNKAKAVIEITGLDSANKNVKDASDVNKGINSAVLLSCFEPMKLFDEVINYDEISEGMNNESEEESEEENEDEDEDQDGEPDDDEEEDVVNETGESQSQIHNDFEKELKSKKNKTKDMIKCEHYAELALKYDYIYPVPVYCPRPMIMQGNSIMNSFNSSTTGVVGCLFGVNSLKQAEEEIKKMRHLQPKQLNFD